MADAADTTDATDAPTAAADAGGETKPKPARRPRAKAAASKAAEGAAARPARRRAAKPKSEPEGLAGAIGTAAGSAGETVKDAAQGAAKIVARPARAVASGARTGVRAAKRTAARVVPARKPALKKDGVAEKGGRSGTGTMLGIAAAGLAAGLVANLGRKAMVQAPSALAGDWFEALKAEHRMALTLFAAIEGTKSTQKAKRSTLLMQLKHALGKHAFTEENVIYPLLREQGEVEEADKLNHEHGYVKDYLYRLETMPKDAPEFLSTVARFRADLEKHIREEEDEVFPSIHQKLGAEKNRAITLMANKEGFKLA